MAEIYFSDVHIKDMRGIMTSNKVRIIRTTIVTQPTIFWKELFT